MFTKYSHILYSFWFSKQSSDRDDVIIHLRNINVIFIKDRCFTQSHQASQRFHPKLSLVTTELKAWFFASAPHNSQRVRSLFSAHSNSTLNCSPSAVPFRKSSSLESEGSGEVAKVKFWKARGSYRVHWRQQRGLPGSDGAPRGAVLERSPFPLVYFSTVRAGGGCSYGESDSPTSWHFLMRV